MCTLKNLFLKRVTDAVYPHAKRQTSHTASQLFLKMSGSLKKNSPKKVNPHARDIIETPDMFILKS